MPERLTIAWGVVQNHSSVYPLILHTLSFKPNTQRWERLTCGKTTITVKCTALWICVCSVSEPIENTTAHTVRVCSRASLKKTNMQLEAANELKEKKTDLKGSQVRFPDSLSQRGPSGALDPRRPIFVFPRNTATGRLPHHPFILTKNHPGIFPRLHRLSQGMPM